MSSYRSTVFFHVEESVNAPPVSGKGRKRTKGGGSSGSGDFRVEYAKSNKSTCKGCDEKIIKGETRISKKDYETAEARRFGGLDRWHHVECFAKLRADLGYYGSGDELPGVKELSKEDRNSLKAALPKMTQGEMPPPPKKIKEELEDAEDAKLMKKQNEELYAIKDQISHLEKNKLVALLEKNHQEIPTGTSNVSTCDIYFIIVLLKKYLANLSYILHKILCLFIVISDTCFINQILFIDLESFIRYTVLWSSRTLSKMQRTTYI